MIFVMNHASSAKSIAQPVGQQSSLLPLYQDATCNYWEKPNKTDWYNKIFCIDQFLSLIKTIIASHVVGLEVNTTTVFNTLFQLLAYLILICQDSVTCVHFQVQWVEIWGNLHLSTPTHSCGNERLTRSEICSVLACWNDRILCPEERKVCRYSTNNTILTCPSVYIMTFFATKNRFLTPHQRYTRHFYFYIKQLEHILPRDTEK